MKVRIAIEGTNVQEVGYRLFLMTKARELEGFEAYNEGNGLVVLIEGDGDSVNRFLDSVKKEIPPSASVSGVKSEPYDGTVMRLREFREQFNSEQLVKIAVTGVEMKGDVKEMKGDIKTIIGKQEETLTEIRSLRNDLKSWMNERLDRIERDVSMIKQKIGL